MGIVKYDGNDTGFTINTINTPLNEVHVNPIIPWNWFDESVLFGVNHIETRIKHIYADVTKGVVVVKWYDNTITKVKLGNTSDIWDLEAAVDAAVVKKLYVSHSHWQKFIREHTTDVSPHSKKKNG